jgi:hypothetical protein
MSELNWELIYQKLSAPFSDDAIQRTKGTETKKHYDTSGIGYQYLVNRFNEVLGNQWGYDWEVLKTIEGQYGSGKPNYEITVKVSIWCLSPGNFRTLVGSHISSVHGDALKGAITNSFKKTAAMWGVGRQAYEGTLDDDSSYGEELGSKKKDKPKPEPKPEPEEPKKEVETITDPLGGTGIKTETNTSGIATTRTLLTFDELIQKMATSKNKFEIAARCKKYKEDYSKLDVEHQKFVIIERDKRILWLTKGEGIYKDEETRGIDKPKDGVK